MNSTAKKILICGDSFSADWSAKHQDYKGWPILLADTHQVTNLSQAGCSEYKIWKQLYAADLSLFDYVILSHTSPFRIPIESHPDHYNDVLHKDCDLIYSDIKQSKNKTLQSVADYFEKFFLPEYAIFVHDLIIGYEIKYLESFKGTAIHITGLPQDFKFVDCNNCLFLMSLVVVIQRIYQIQV